MVSLAYLRRLATEEHKKLYPLEYFPSLRFISKPLIKYSFKLCLNHYGEWSVQSSPVYLPHLSPQQIRDRLRHILVHIRLFTLGLPFADSTSTFKRECKRLNVKAKF